jgi:single-strand DNA-binding protein
MAGDTPITVVGNLTADPELRFTPSGAAVANFTVASTPRSFDRQTNEWKDQDTLFLNCSVWRQAAENAAESLTRGMRVIVQGRLKARSYETREGEKRTVFEIDVEEVGPSLRSATAKVSKTSRSGGGQGFASGGGDDPWASNQGSSGNSGGGGQPAATGGGSWGGQQGGGSGGSGYSGGSQGGQGGSQGGSQGGAADPWAAPGTGHNDEPPF